MNTEYPLTLVNFKSWLESKTLDEEVGQTGEPTCCPIANFLKEEDVSQDVYVDWTTTMISNEEIEYPNPLWVRKFIDEVDMLDDEDREQDIVTAKDALEIVNNLYICTVCNQYNPEGTNCGKKDNCPW